MYSITVGFSPILYCWPMLLPQRNPFKCHEEVLHFQPMIPPKRFDIFPPDWGMLRRSRRILIFLWTRRAFESGRPDSLDVLLRVPARVTPLTGAGAGEGKVALVSAGFRSPGTGSSGLSWGFCIGFIGATSAFERVASSCVWSCTVCLCASCTRSKILSWASGSAIALPQRET